MRVTITCEECGTRHPLERRVADPGEIWVICHGCELPLRAELDPGTATAHTTSAAALQTPFAQAWGGTLDLASA